MLPPPRPALWPLRPFASADVTDELLPDGRRRITVRHAELAGVTPEMLDWWYGHVDGPMEYAGSTWPRYLVWHPFDHIAYEVLRTAPDGTVGPGARLRIREAFQRDPRNLLDVTVEVEHRDADAAIIAKRVAGGQVLRLVNEFSATRRGTAYRSRMELGTASIAGRLGLNRLVRRRILAGAKARAWGRHHVEEVGNLVHFLPDLWAGQSGVAPGRTRRRRG
jgi:hypothetical protein